MIYFSNNILFQNRKGTRKIPFPFISVRYFKTMGCRIEDKGRVVQHFSDSASKSYHHQRITSPHRNGTAVVE